MKIKFNEVTWYSKLAAIIFFAVVFPAIAFFIGKQYGLTSAIMQDQAICEQK